MGKEALISSAKQIYIDIDWFKSFLIYLEFFEQEHFKSKDVLNLIYHGLDWLCLKVTEIWLILESVKSDQKIFITAPMVPDRILVSKEWKRSCNKSKIYG